MLTTFKVLIEFVTMLLLLCFSGMWDLSSLTRDQTSTPALEGEVLINNIYLFWLHWVFIAAWVFSSFSKWGCSLVVVHGLLIVVASLAVEHGLQVYGLQ